MDVIAKNLSILSHPEDARKKKDKDKDPKKNTCHPHCKKFQFKKLHLIDLGK